MACGIDIGGTKIELALFDASLNRIAAWRERTPGRDYATFLSTLAAMTKTAETFAGERQAVGLALPGIVDAGGQWISVHVPCLNGRRVIEDIETALGRPVPYDNDTRAFSLSEARGGALSGFAVAMGIILGTGVSGALCLAGRLYPSERRIAGEFGHVAIPPNLIDTYNLPVRACSCGATACAEQMLSGPSLLAVAERMGARYSAVEALVEDMRAGAAPARRAFAAYVDCLGYFVSRVTLMLDPDAVVFGGGLSNITELYERLPERVATWLFDGVRPPMIVAPKFGASGGARGAAILAIESGS